MIETDRQWLDEHRNYLYVSSRMSSIDTHKIYEIYNRLTGQSKKPNGCGSCLRNTINIIKMHYEQKTNN